MKILVLLCSLFAITALGSCQKIERSTADNTQTKRVRFTEENKKCVDERLLAFQQQESCDDATIKSYTFQGQLVYVLDYGDCIADVTSEVVSEDCKVLGYLGGLAGSSTLNGTEFWSNAIFVTTVWHKLVLYN
ncbi:hypothetical protein DBR32_00750 [Taibaiella sp. KBW10]|uniref:DUF6970 domain-containing protein n=1 Tax=Taibaiella sp. KBW10 TaxID=2153357 RepID=UPI000F5B6563|nr:hypothetical protein [Taibaiella sp. KBW10]RQO32176.1 hypothetical protein DBR32_00750 [Taibaiella sp. KBW10]